MRVISGRDNLQLSPTPRAVAVGGFDGFHVGHQYLLTHLCGLAWERGFESSLLTFEPIPAEYFAPPGGPPKRLTTREERVTLAAALCCDLMVILDFDAAMAAESARDFCREILVEKLNVKLLMASSTHTLGHERAGLDQIAELGRELGFEVVAAPILSLGDLRVSSTEVRRLLAEGHVEETAALLGRRYHFSGRVVSGRGIGRELGFPTANLAPPANKILPADAVYAGLAVVEEGPAELVGRLWPAAVSLGNAPTYGLTERLVEAHLLTAEALELSGTTLRLEFVRRLRWQQKFATPEALQAQIAQDVSETQRLCAAHLASAAVTAARMCPTPTLPGCAGRPEATDTP